VLHPPSVRVFDSFERHEQPFFSFRNTAPIYGPDAEVPYPEGTEELDFGLGIAAVIGAGGAVGGFTIANDWTARDLERAERASGFGPSKSKDFALSLGPAVVTADELAGGTTMVGRVNGEERARADLGRLVWTWQEVVDHAARNTVLRPGDVLICSAPGGGSALAAGDIVELEVDGIGSLTCRVR
jgi:fumarylacetoacetate (FAA) hydrolase